MSNTIACRVFSSQNDRVAGSITLLNTDGKTILTNCEITDCQITGQCSVDGKDISHIDLSNYPKLDSPNTFSIDSEDKNLMNVYRDADVAAVNSSTNDSNFTFGENAGACSFLQYGYKKVSNEPDTNQPNVKLGLIRTNNGTPEEIPFIELKREVTYDSENPPNPTSTDDYVQADKPIKIKINKNGAPLEMYYDPGTTSSSTQTIKIGRAPNNCFNIESYMRPQSFLTQRLSIKKSGNSFVDFITNDEDHPVYEFNEIVRVNKPLSICSSSSLPQPLLNMYTTEFIDQVMQIIQKTNDYGDNWTYLKYGNTAAENEPSEQHYLGQSSFKIGLGKQNEDETIEESPFIEINKKINYDNNWEVSSVDDYIQINKRLTMNNSTTEASTPLAVYTPNATATQTYKLGRDSYNCGFFQYAVVSTGDPAQPDTNQPIFRIGQYIATGNPQNPTQWESFIQLRKDLIEPNNYKLHVQVDKPLTAGDATLTSLVINKPGSTTYTPLAVYTPNSTATQTYKLGHDTNNCGFFQYAYASSDIHQPEFRIGQFIEDESTPWTPFIYLERVSDGSSGYLNRIYCNQILETKLKTASAFGDNFKDAIKAVVNSSSGAKGGSSSENSVFKSIYPIGSVFISYISFHNMGYSLVSSSPLRYSWNDCVWEFINDEIYLKNGKIIDGYEQDPANPDVSLRKGGNEGEVVNNEVVNGEALNGEEEELFKEEEEKRESEQKAPIITRKAEEIPEGQTHLTVFMYRRVE